MPLSFRLAARLWLFTATIFGSGWLMIGIFNDDSFLIEMSWVAWLVAAICSVPVLPILLIAIRIIKKKNASSRNKTLNLLAICFICAAAYGITLGMAFAGWSYRNGFWSFFLEDAGGITGALFLCSFFATLLSQKLILATMAGSHPSSNQQLTMDNSNAPEGSAFQENPHGNKIFIKGLIIAGLILLLLIPTYSITNLVSERQERQNQVAEEVSSKWASSQTLFGPFIYLPYKIVHVDPNGKTISEEKKQCWVIPDDLEVDGTVDHEIRKRSIYRVLLYRTSLRSNGHFVLQIPKELDPASIVWQEAKICFGLSDFKGIEEKMQVDFNGASCELSPGLPGLDDQKGLSASVPIHPSDLGRSIPFRMGIKIKGSDQLHFVPLAGNSSFSLRSSWNSPSFDGNALPSQRDVNDSGFTAKWVFNRANLPFSTVMNDFKMDWGAIAFGVTLVQPADGYSKTNRCIKYGVLFIGLTFSLFFAVELLHKKPLHPVQYMLIGLGLVIFYTLLLAISEYILFDFAYGIAALATILLITFYSKDHFKSWKSAMIFGSMLTILYGFIFILIRLEDTALLIGSIGLFVILALVMIATRKVNWYGTPVVPAG